MVARFGLAKATAYRARDREVRVGDDVKGIVHGKSMLVRYLPPSGGLPVKVATCVIGSTIWTDSSTANLEFSAVLREPGAAFVQEWLSEFERGWSQGTDLAAALEAADKGGYGRRSASRSASRSLGRSA